MLILSACEKETHKKYNIVVTFSVLESFVKEIIKDSDSIEVITLIGPDQDPHTYMATPHDYIKIAKANILIENGLGFEPWLKDMIKNTSFKKKHVISSQGIVPIRFLKDNSLWDPHAWHNVQYAKIYVQNISNAICEMDPQNEELYKQNTNRFLLELDQLDSYIRKKLHQLQTRTVVTTHDAFWYFGKAYSIKFLSPIGISTEEEYSATQVASLIEYIKKQKVQAVFLENLSNSSAVEQIAKETNTKIGGVLYADALSETNTNTRTYVGTMKYNTDQLYEALK